MNCLVSELVCQREVQEAVLRMHRASYATSTELRVAAAPLTVDYSHYIAEASEE